MEQTVRINKIGRRMTDKLMLVDCDGAIINWQSGFDAWMLSQGYRPAMDNHTQTYHIDEQYGMPRNKIKVLIAQFNESSAIATLPALRDSVQYIKKLQAEHNYSFHCITSLSDADHAYDFRQTNLLDVFGDRVFSALTCLSLGANKDSALEEYRDSGLYWVEDKKENAALGADIGLNALLMTHPYNADFTHPGVTRVHNWREIYNIVTAT